MNDFSDQIARLSPQKRALLALRLQKTGDEFNAFPLSFAQERLWFLQQYEPDNTIYNITTAVHLQGKLDIPVLEQALQAVLQRHEVLRTTFIGVEGKPVQVISASLEWHLPLLDLRHVALEQQNDLVEQLLVEESRHVFDLARGPLFRIHLLLLGPDEHAIFLNMHHIISDGWSMSLLIRQSVTAYEAFKQGHPSPLGDLPIQYADFARWQRGWLQGEVLQKQLAYWQDQLAPPLPTLQLPADFPRPARQTFVGAHEPVQLTAAQVAALAAIGRKQGASLFMVLLAAFSTLLYRYTNQSDIIIGTPVTNRSKTELEELIGFFVNTLVLRLQLEAEDTFLDVVSRVRDVVLGAHAHQDIPFEKLVEILQPERHLSHSPFFQVMFAFHEAPMAQPKMAGLTLTPIEVDNGTSKFDLSFLLERTGNEITGKVEYNTDLFEAGTIRRMIGHFNVILSAVSQKITIPISHLPLLTPAERQQLSAWNAPSHPYPQQCVHTTFEAQCQRTPDAIALVGDGTHLSYALLNRRANQLAHALQAEGVTTETAVGLYGTRSPEAIIGMLGILKAGGTYVPLDPAYPAERLKMMIQDADIRILLTQSSLEAANSGLAPKIIYLNESPDSFGTWPTSNPVSAVTNNNLAYIMYTSGSTGRPKGVCISHHNIMRLVSDVQYVHLGASEIFFQFASLSFDAATFEIWGCLAHGGRLVIPQAHALSLVELGTLLQRHRVSTLWLTAGLFHQMAQHQPDSLAKIKQLLAGGDVLSAVAVAQTLSHMDDGIVINGYGPTESTTFACCYTVRSSEQVKESVPIGFPIDHTQAHILDRHLQPVPIGIPGELFLGGDGLARAYHNRPGLTAAHFIPNPFSQEPGARLYRTGDLVRRQANGAIEFLGRQDTQIKVRGFRVEPGEIETTLDQNPAVRQSAVLAIPDTSGDKQLIAYIVPLEPMTPEALRQHVANKLPAYMLPSQFVFLDRLPLTVNGKLDRRALLARENQFSPEQNDVSTTPVEELLLGIWRELLPEGPIGVHDNFFQIGGHSLIATQVVSRIRDRFQIDLPLRDFFEAATIAQLANVITAARRQPLPPIRPFSREDSPPLSFAQHRLWVTEQLVPGTAIYHLPITIKLEGTLDIPALEQSFAEMTRRHQILRTTFNLVDNEACQNIQPFTGFTLPVIDLQALPESQRQSVAETLAQEASHRLFDLENGPLWRVLLLKWGQSIYWLQLTMHQIVADGWSLGILTREIATVYSALAAGKRPSLPDLPIQYADFSRWQHTWLQEQGEAFQTLLTYWHQQLQGAPPVLQLPTDHPRPAVQTYQGRTLSYTLPAQTTAELKEIGRRYGATLFMTLLAAYKILLYYHSQQKDILVGSPIANRTQTETEPLLGFFVNTLVLRTQLEDEMSFVQLLQSVSETALAAYDHQDMPFEKLVEHLQPERTPSHTPLIQVWFAFQNFSVPTVELPGLTFTPIQSEEDRAMFDLALLLWDGPQGIHGTFEYNCELFETQTIRRMAEHFTVIINHVCQHPLTSLAQLTARLDELTQQQHSQAEKAYQQNIRQRLQKTKRKSTKPT